MYLGLVTEEWDGVYNQSENPERKIQGVQTVLTWYQGYMFESPHSMLGTLNLQGFGAN
jgi:hypothetical protein